MSDLVTIIMVLALCAATYVMVISALAVILYWMNRSTLEWFVPPVPVLDLRAARLGGIDA